MIFKKNIWMIFYAILLLSALAIFGMTYNKAVSIHNEQQIENQAITKLLSQSFNSSLTEDELLLNILGNRLLENNLYQDKAKTHHLLQQMLDTKPSLAGFGLANPQGDLIAISGNMDQAKLPNLLQQPSSKADFELALKSSRMVIGRNYYFPPLKHWVIPMRKALRDSTGKVVAVMTMGILLDKSSFIDTHDLANNTQVVFINGINRFRIYIPGAKPAHYDFLYGQAIRGKIIQRFKDVLASDYGTSIDQVNQSKTARTFIATGESDFLKQDVNTVSVFDPKYRVWTFLLQSTTTFYNTLFDILSQYLMIYIATNLIIFWLFLTIARNDAKNKAQLAYKAEHDSLTGLYNRNYLETLIPQKIETRLQAVLFIDLDNFKTINDSFGHHLGDLLLRKVTKRLTAFAHGDDILIRIGGDEFVLLVFNSDNEQQLAADIIKEISNPYDLNGMRFILDASIGITLTGKQQVPLETLISEADIAMYSAKQRKSSVEYFSDDLYQNTARKLLIEQQLRSALDNHEIHLVYQPQIRSDGSIHGVEALARWHNKTLGNVAPDEFILIAEDVGLMPKIGQYIAQKAAHEICQLQQKLSSSFKLSINISVKQLLDPQFFDKFSVDISSCALNPINLTIEMTESVFIEEIEAMLPLLHKLKALGISISLDDFGTGYSSLSLLRLLPLDEIKIDKSFVDHIHENEKDQGMVATIISIAKKMDAHPLAEGVETLEQLELLKQFGCEIFQGYYFSKPLSLEDLENFINKNIQQ